MRLARAHFVIRWDPSLFSDTTPELKKGSLALESIRNEHNALAEANGARAEYEI